MKERYGLYLPEEINDRYEEIAQIYQVAFASEPWFEVSKCVDRLQRCGGGLSSLAVGSFCELCQVCTKEEAYTTDELCGRFEQIESSEQAVWYLEETEAGIVLAGLAWVADAAQVAEKKYDNNEEMRLWMEAQLGKKEFIWLDEVFADRVKRPARNLDRFQGMVRQMSGALGQNTVAYRTIVEQVTRAATREFSSSRVLERNKEVPDRRDFVVIDVD